jgi:hypothetical protein
VVSGPTLVENLIDSIRTDPAGVNMQESGYATNRSSPRRRPENGRLRPRKGLTLTFYGISDSGYKSGSRALGSSPLAQTEFQGAFDRADLCNMAWDSSASALSKFINEEFNLFVEDRVGNRLDFRQAGTTPRPS